MLSHIRENAGFTLIEISIVLLISSIFLTAGISLYDRYLLEKRARVTVENLDLVYGGLAEFFAMNGRYPCPADPTLNSADANYGLEDCSCAGNLVCTSDGDPADQRDMDNDGNWDEIMIGTLPHVTLAENINFGKFRAKNGFDGYNNKFTYAVSSLMADTIFSAVNPANRNFGAICLRDEFGRDIVTPKCSAHYVIFSHGRTGVGAYSRQGTPAGDGCELIDINGDPAPDPEFNVSTLRVELENCDNNDIYFVKSLYSNADNINFYDDTLYFNANSSTALWRPSLLANQYQEIWLYNTNLGHVGVGDPVNFNDPEAKLHVDGSVSVGSTGWTEAEGGYCDSDGLTCLDPRAIGGTLMPPCGSGQVATGIANSQLICENLVFTTNTIAACPVGEFLTGFSNLGNRTCAAP